jgi:Ca2+-dependent lipid-binding protein
MGNSKSSKVDVHKETQEPNNSNEITIKSSSNGNKNINSEENQKQNGTTDGQKPVIPKLKLSSSESIKSKQFSSSNTRIANSNKLNFSNDSDSFIKTKIRINHFQIKKGGKLY